MEVASSFVHLVAYNTIVKMKFKRDIIWVRLFILNFLYYAKLCGMM
jgi:hypothetical protein